MGDSHGWTDFLIAIIGLSGVLASTVLAWHLHRRDAMEEDIERLKLDVTDLQSHLRTKTGYIPISWSPRR